MDNNQWWSGVTNATYADYEDIRKRYDNSDLEYYNFCLTTDLRRVEVTNSKQSANGYWTLAEITTISHKYDPDASGRLDKIAKLMLQAVGRFEAGE